MEPADSTQKRVRTSTRSDSSVNAILKTDKGNGCNNVLVTITNLDVLDCKVCLEPLTIPVYQCKHGHSACSACCRRLKDKCPYCKFQMSIRSRLVEEILESVKVSCKYLDYGCKEMISYCNKVDHEVDCTHVPHFCSKHDCDFRGTWDQLNQHFCDKHARSVQTFQYHHSFHVDLSRLRGTYVLKEEGSGGLFVLRNKMEPSVGNLIAISRVTPYLDNQPEYLYELTATAGRNVMKSSHRMGNVRNISVEYAGSSQVLAGNFFNSKGWMTLKLLIQGHDHQVSGSRRN